MELPTSTHIFHLPKTMNSKLVRQDSNELFIGDGLCGRCYACVTGGSHPCQLTDGVDAQSPLQSPKAQEEQSTHNLNWHIIQEHLHSLPGCPFGYMSRGFSTELNSPRVDNSVLGTVQFKDYGPKMDASVRWLGPKSAFGHDGSLGAIVSFPETLHFDWNVGDTGTKCSFEEAVMYAAECWKYCGFTYDERDGTARFHRKIVPANIKSAIAATLREEGDGEEGKFQDSSQWHTLTILGILEPIKTSYPLRERDAVMANGNELCSSFFRS